MGVYIKGMEMPTSCDDCFLPLRYCPYAMTPDGSCPLVFVPPHGDLIDRDANLMSLRKVLHSPFVKHGSIETAMLRVCIKVFEEAPTIIPAEEVE